MGKDQRNKKHGLDLRRNRKRKRALREAVAPSPIEQLERIVRERQR